MLEALYDATGGPDWIDNTNWKTSAPLGEWFGVTTDTTGRVTRLALPGNGLAGPIPAALGELALLRNLSFGGRWDSAELFENALTGPIPAELGNLANLEQLSLGSNALTGPVPSWLGRLTSLRSLDLGGNELTGPIPAELGNLANLEWLSLGSNALTGPAPSWLGRLASLRSLSLGWNDLTGPIPAELGNLANLEWLSLGGNALTGPVPSWLVRLTSLRSLSLGWNDLTGPIPAELGNLANLEWLSLGGNALTGPIPAELGNLANLEGLYLGPNPLTGSLPQDLTRLSQLRTLDISSTGACAPADAEFQAWLETLADFRGDTCNRSPESVDTIPPQALTESGPAVSVSMDAYFADPDDDPLTYTAASSQAGTVTTVASGDTVWLVPGAAGTATVTVTATDPGGLSATQTIAVTVNASARPQNDREVLEVLYDSTGGESWTNRSNWKTSTPLDDWYGVTIDTAGRVTELDLSGNDLTGPIPAALGDLELLQTLSLGGRWEPASRQWLTNALIGPIPAELGRLENLQQLSLGDNALTGPIPRELRDLVNLRSLSLSGNDLTGPIPAELGRLTNLQSLSLRGNDLTGPIPREVGSLVNLQYLYLERNDLIGPIPAGLSRLSNLRSLSLWGNDLTGQIPAELGNLANLRSLSLGSNDLTGPIPAELGNLANLRSLSLGSNDLTGPIPAELGNLANLEGLSLGSNGLSGPIPAALGRLSNLRRLDFWHSWGLSGPLPGGLESSSLEDLGIFATQACAPTAWEDWLDTIEFEGRLCEVEPEVAIDVAVFYTPAAREEAGGTAEIEAVIDLMVAETNEAYQASGVHHRLALVARSEVQYAEAGDFRDIGRFADPADGYMDEVHAMRDRTGADLVHLIFKWQDHPFGGVANFGGAFGLTCQNCGGGTFAHELGHNMGLRHDRYAQLYSEIGRGPVTLDPAFGYVNQLGLAAGAARSRRWVTIMSYRTQCGDTHTSCSGLLRFSNPRQSYNDDPLGVPFGSGGSGVTGPADAAGVLNATGPAVALWRDHVPRPNRPPEAVGTLPDRRLTGLSSTLEVDVSQAFVDPDGDLLSYGVSSSSPRVVAAQAVGARVTLTAVGEGMAAIRVTAADPGGLSAAQTFTVTVGAMRAPFTDDPIVPGVTPIKAIHFTELRTRIDALRSAGGLARFSWSDPVLRPGVTRIQRVHLLELRSALAGAYRAAGRAAPGWTDAAPSAGTTPIRALHVTELRAAVLALE